MAATRWFGCRHHWQQWRVLCYDGVELCVIVDHGFNCYSGTAQSRLRRVQNCRCDHGGRHTGQHDPTQYCDDRVRLPYRRIDQQTVHGRCNPRLAADFVVFAVYGVYRSCRTHLPCTEAVTKETPRRKRSVLGDHGPGNYSGRHLSGYFHRVRSGSRCRGVLHGDWLCGVSHPFS